MTLQEYVEDWRKKVMKANPAFNMMPACPYAHTVKRIECCEAEDMRDVSYLVRAYYHGGLEPREVVVIDCPLELRAGVRAFVEMETTIAQQYNIELLLSDCEAPFVIRGFRTTQDSKLLILLQNHQELRRLRGVLQASNYYNHWDALDLKRL